MFIAVFKTYLKRYMYTYSFAQTNFLKDIFNSEICYRYDY